MVYLTTDDVGGSLRDLLDVYLNWNGIIGYTSDIMDYWEDIFDKDEEGIREFLDEEGIYGYTSDILDLLNSGEVTISDMDEEDLIGLKRQLGIRENVRGSMRRRRLKENEIRRYSDVVPYEKRRYWYWTKHGLGPGTLPKGVNVLDAKEGQNQKGTWGVFVLLDAVLNSSELREYDIIELAPEEERKPLKANIWNADGTITTGDIVEGTKSLGEGWETADGNQVDESDIVVYQFPHLYRADIRKAEEYGLEDVTKEFKDWNPDDDTYLRGELRDLESFGINYIGDYQLVDGYLFDDEGVSCRFVEGVAGSRNQKINEGLVEPDKEDIEFFETYITNTLGFDIERKGKTLFGSNHYQVRSIDKRHSMEDLRDFAKSLKELDDLMEKRNIPMTYNAGLDEEGYITAGLDLRKKYVPGAPDDVDESLKESRQLNEGPGAGYSIKGSLNDIVVNDFKIIQQYQIDDAFPDDPDYTVFEIICDIDGVLEDVEVSSYYYGGMISTVPVKITHMEIFANGVPEEPTEEDVEYMLSSNFEIDCNLGGGWSHSNFDGELLINHPSEWNYNSNIDLKDINIKFENPQAVDVVNKYATGENYTTEYRTDDGEYFETKEEAIEYAEENDCDFVEEVKEFWSYDGENYDYEDTDLVGKVWVNPKTEGAYDGEVL